MFISESVLTAHLKNVYWIGGGACGGKSTMADKIAAKYGFKAYHPEYIFMEHKALANIVDHPTMLTPFHGWEWFFNRPPDEYAAFITGSDLEHIQMVIPDVIKLATNQTVIVDGHLLEPAFLKQITTDDRVFFLFADDEVIRHAYFNREDKQGMLGVINTLADHEKARQNIYKVARLISEEKIKKVTDAGFKYLIRDRDSTIEGVLGTLEKHFGLRE